MMTELVIVRGLPGSGKSTLAKQMDGYAHYEADMFFVDENGNYKFSPDDLPKAHTWCQRSVYNALKCGINVVVSNTFVRAWEMKPYFDMGFPVRVVTCNGKFANEHGVPESVIRRMEENWEPVELVDFI